MMVFSFKNPFLNAKRSTGQKLNGDARVQAMQQAQKAQAQLQAQPQAKTIESNGPKGLEPTRYGDWEKSGRCIDF